jgi:oxygen-dependent protoporphyrinogen oxidase
MNHDKTRVAVVGAGISGLAAAHQLSTLDAALDITVFEASEKLGGVLQTEQVDGFRIELGPDSVLSRLPWGVDLLRRVGLADELINTSDSHQGVHVVCRGRLERVPEGLAVMAPQKIWPLVTTPILSWRGKFRLAAERFIPARRSRDDESLADFVRRRLGRETFERLVQPLAGGIYMGDPEQLSVQATFPQFVEMEFKYGSLIKATRAARSKSGASTTAAGPEYSLFVAPRRGFGSLIEALESQLSDCRICRNHQVLEISQRDQGWSVQVKEKGAQDSRREHFSGVVVAAPAYHAGSMLQKADQELSQLLAEIPYAGCVVVNLGYDRQAFPHPLDSFGFVVPHVEKRSVLACTFSSVKYAERALDNRVLLRAFLGGACFPEVLQWSDERILQTVQDELRQLLQVSEPPLFSRIKRWHRAMPQNGLGHSQRVERIEQFVEKLPRLELAGNCYHGVGIPHCIRSGQQASDRLLKALQ